MKLNNLTTEEILNILNMELDNSEKILLLFVSIHCDEFGVLENYSADAISRVTKISSIHISKRLKKLSADGILKNIGKNKRINSYYLTFNNFKNKTSCSNCSNCSN